MNLHLIVVMNSIKVVLNYTNVGKKFLNGQKVASNFRFFR